MVRQRRKTIRNTLDDFACEKCDKFYKSKASLSNHVKTKHSKVRCDHCSKQFTYKPTLQKHMKQKHPEYCQNGVQEIPPTLQCNSGEIEKPKDFNQTECSQLFNDVSLLVTTKIAQRVHNLRESFLNTDRTHIQEKFNVLSSMYD